MESLESMGAPSAHIGPPHEAPRMGPHRAGSMEPDPGPGSFAIGGRSQQQYVREKNDVSHAEMYGPKSDHFEQMSSLLDFG